MCLTIDPTSRPTAAEMLGHKWLASDQRHFVPDTASPSGGPTNLLPHIQKAFDAKKTCTPRFAPVALASVRRLLTRACSRSPESGVLDDRDEAHVVARRPLTHRAAVRPEHRGAQGRVREGARRRGASLLSAARKLTLMRL